MMPNLNDYKSEILFLLIGNNPLPNYIAAKLLSKPFAEEKPILCLIYSQDTEKYAKNLIQVLGKTNFTFMGGKVTPWNYLSIRREVEQAIDAIKQLAKNSNNFSVGLNYTGGTKAMSVHVYRAIKELENSGIKTHFSYLDSDQKKMRIDVDNSSQEVSFDLSDENEPYFNQAKISLDELLKLHSWEKLNPAKDAPRFPETLKVLNDIVINNWQNYYEKVRTSLRSFEDDFNKIHGFKAHEKENKQGDYENFLKGKSIDFTDFQNLRAALSTDIPATNLLQNNNLILANLPNTVSAIEIYKFLDSFWIENYVLQEAKAVETDCNLHDCLMGYVVKLPRINRPFFEVDVIAMRGYQLFAFSCTIIEGMKSKEKLFEIAHRARQMGGAESRLGLVCLAESRVVRTLREQLEDDNIEVFGKDDLKNLRIKLKVWFNKK